ncbi:hypothetical protein SLA2020_368950 [Shorea laevis]
MDIQIHRPPITREDYNHRELTSCADLRFLEHHVLEVSMSPERVPYVAFIVVEYLMCSAMVGKAATNLIAGHYSINGNTNLVYCVYVHPLVKCSLAMLSEESLEL